METQPILMNPTLSIVVPAYNEERRLSLCLSAIAKAVKGRSDVEVIVVDNASTDRTAEVARGYGVIVVSEPEKGLVRARAAGYRAASGALIGNVDADTEMQSDWVERVLAEFAHDPDLLAFSGPSDYTDLSVPVRIGVRLFYLVGYVGNAIGRLLFRRGAMLQGGNFVVRRSALEEIGGYDTSIEFYGEDTDIARRIAMIGKLKWSFSLSMPTSGRRLREEGVVRTAWKYAVNYLSVTLRARPATKEYADIRDPS